MADASVLKSFLVSIGFKVDEAGYKKFQTQMDSLTKRMVVLGEEATFTAIAMGVAVKSMAADLEKLYFVSQRTGSSVTSLRAFGLGAEAVGVSADTAFGAISRLTSMMRSNPGYGGLLRSMGVDTQHGGEATMTGLIDKLNEMIAKQHGNRTQATMIAQLFGLDEQTFFQMSKFADERKKEKKRYEDWVKTLKLGDGEMKQDIESSHQFMNNLRFLRVEMDTLGTIMEARFLPAMETLTRWFGGIVTLFAKWDKSTNGASSWGAGVGAALGSGWAVKKLFSLLRGGGAAVAEGGAAVAEGGAAVAEGGAAEGVALGGPVAWGVAAVVAIGAALVWMKTHPKEVGEAAKAAWETVKDAGHSAQEWGKAEGSYLKKYGLGAFIRENLMATGNPVLANMVDKMIPMGSGLMSLVRSSEGFRDKAYWDVNHWSIGYGTRSTQGATTTREAAERQLQASLNSARALVMQYIHGPATSGTVDALTSLAYNIGGGNFAGSKHLLSDIGASNWSGVQQDILGFDTKLTPGGRVHDAGLHARREKEAAMVGTGSSISQNIDIDIHGAGDPARTGDEVLKAMRQVHADLQRATCNNGGAR